MQSLPSSATERVRQAKHALVLDLFLRRGAAWDAIRAVRERWRIEARAQIPPPYRGGPYFPEAFGPPPPMEEWDSAEYNHWHATYREWMSALEGVYDAAVPEEARSSRYFVGSGWDLFISMCALYDPPETALINFAEHVGWRHSNVIHRGEHVGDGLPITWLRDATRVEEAWARFYEASIEAILETFVHPQGITSEEVHRRIRKDRPELFAGFVRDLCAIESGHRRAAAHSPNGHRVGGRDVAREAGEASATAASSQARPSRGRPVRGTLRQPQRLERGRRKRTGIHPQAPCGNVRFAKPTSRESPHRAGPRNSPQKVGCTLAPW
jgi:hypothetical protein